MVVTPPVGAAFVEGVVDWRGAVRTAAAQLVELGVAGPDYVEACVTNIDEHGPYIVLTPGVALVHAQAEKGSTTEGLAVLRLAKPVAFGHPTNDPVDVLLAFSSGGSHMQMIRSVAEALSAGLADRIRAAATETDAEAELQRVVAP